MKCPYCEEALQRVDSLDFIYRCDNVFCEETEGMGGTKELWQELIRTRKALDVAVDALKHYCTDSGNWSCIIDFTGDYDNAPSEFADTAIDKIKTALEQKDVK